MHHNHRWVLATLVSVAQFGSKHTRSLGSLELHRLEQQPCQYGGGHFAKRRLVRLPDAAPHGTQTLALDG